MIERPRAANSRSEQRLEQELELADLDLAFKGVVGAIDDGNRQGAIVAIALKLGDDASVFDLTLADTDLELSGILAGVAEVDVLHVGIEGIELGLLVRALEAMTGVERQGQPGDGLAKLEGDLRIAGKGLGVRSRRPGQVHRAWRWQRGWRVA